MNDPTPNIWLLQTQLDVDGLVKALSHPDATIRKRAAAALRTLGAISVIPVLENRLADEPDTEVRETLAAALEHLIAERGPVRNAETRHLVDQLNSEDLGQVMRAIHRLAALKDKTAAEALVLVFENQALSHDIRLAAAEALIALESPPAIVVLLVALRRDEWRIRRNAAAVLGQLGADWATGALIERLDDENELVRRTAHAALMRIGTPEALRAVQPDVSQSPSPQTPAQPLPQNPDEPSDPSD
ncbi:MAG: HEAT repeat domain-containing protein [Anaerolineae bacterium]|nr:HEAT repeat domain-containing protein [Anaerolineae bacterium]